MGCSFCNPAKEVEEEVPRAKEYSWDKRPKVDPNDFTISNLKGEDVCREPGSVNGQQLVIQNCSNSMIFVLDHIDSINIDDCANCKIILGPVKGSVFVRDCLDCVLVVPCGQFRLRDSHRLDIFLHCATQPIIESSTHIRFACIRLQYNKLKDHMKMAGLSVFNNLWSKIHDFTPVDGDGNWRKLPDGVRLQEYITPPFPSQLRDAGWTVTADSKVMPVSIGIMDGFSDKDICFVLVFGDSENRQKDIAVDFVLSFLTINNQSTFLTSREVQLQQSDGIQMGLESSCAQRLEDGPVVGLVLGGPNCAETCTRVQGRQNLTSEVYFSNDTSVSVRQASIFLQIASMHLGC